MYKLFNFSIILNFIFIINAQAFPYSNSNSDNKYHDINNYTYKKSNNNSKIITRNDGTTYYISGNTITGSDGTNGEIIGNMIKLDNNTTCYIQSTYIDCE